MLPLRFFTISGVFLFLSVGHAHALYPYHSEEYKESATQPISETSILTRAITDPIDPPAQEASQPTTSVTLRGVLPSAFEAGDYNLPPLTLPIEVYDAQNVLHTLNVEITSAGLFAFCVTVHGSDGESVLNETGNAFQTYVDGSGQFLTGMFGSSVGSSLDMHITWNNGEDSIIALQYGEDFSKNNSMIPPTYEHVFGTTERVDPPAQEASQPTTSVTLRGVLPSAFEAGDYNLSPLNMPIEVYDAQNVLHTLNVEINAEAFAFCVTVHGSDGDVVQNEAGSAFQTYIDTFEDDNHAFVTGKFGSSVGSSLDMHITWNNGEDSIIALQYGEDLSNNNRMIPPTYEHVFGTTERVPPPVF